MNTAAVKAWERKHTSPLQSVSNRPRRHRRRRKRLGADKNCTASDIAVELPGPQPQHISETPSHRTGISVSSNHGKNTVRAVEQSSSHFSRSNIVVQISQHSSLDRDVYIAYQSSLSSEQTSSLVVPHKSSGLEEFSSSPATSSLADSNGTIPDSQSLPDSSSYRPTSSTSLAVLGADQTPLSHQSRFLQLNSTNLESSTGAITEANDSTEDSSAVVAASQPSFVESERSKSEPAPITSQSSSASSFGARLPSIPRSASDLILTHHDQHRRRAFVSQHPSDHCAAYDQATQGPIHFHSAHQTPAGYIQQRQRPSEVQVPRSADRKSQQSRALDENPIHDLIFQTQVPLAFASQGSRVSILSAGASSNEPTVTACSLEKKLFN